MTKAYSEAFKRKMVKRLIGKGAISAVQLSKDTGVRQQNLSRWLMVARRLPSVAQHPKQRTWDVAQKARIVAEAVGLEGDQLVRYLEREGVMLVELERWRAALDDRETSSIGMSR